MPAVQIKQIPLSQLTTSDSTQADRIGRDGRPSTCAGKASPGGGFAGTHYYETYTFTNTSGAARCYTVTINAALGGPGDIESVAYDQVYDPTMLDTNYLGDTGISGLGTTVDHASYSFTVPAGHNFVVVVNTTGTTGVSRRSVAQSPASSITPPDLATARIYQRRHLLQQRLPLQPRLQRRHLTDMGTLHPHLVRLRLLRQRLARHQLQRQRLLPHQRRHRRHRRHWVQPM